LIIAAGLGALARYFCFDATLLFVIRADRNADKKLSWDEFKAAANAALGTADYKQPAKPSAAAPSKPTDAAAVEALRASQAREVCGDVCRDVLNHWCCWRRTCC
jgi:hypothetical protein